MRRRTRNLIGAFKQIARPKNNKASSIGKITNQKLRDTAAQSFKAMKNREGRQALKKNIYALSRLPRGQ